jgi:hypothetical protein
MNLYVIIRYYRGPEKGKLFRWLDKRASSHELNVDIQVGRDKQTLVFFLCRVQLHLNNPLKSRITLYRSAFIYNLDMILILYLIMAVNFSKAIYLSACLGSHI